MPNPTQLDRIEAAIAATRADLAAVRSLIEDVINRGINMSASMDQLTQAIVQIDQATTQEAAIITANTVKLDTIQALITSLLADATIPQATRDALARIQTTVTGIVSDSAAQAGRLDALGKDPRDPVPVPPPPAG